jgi:hypothetical protein
LGKCFVYCKITRGGDPVAFSRKERRDIRTLIRFVDIFCRENHGEDFKKPFTPPFEEVIPLVRRRVQLCEPCSELVAYGIRKRFRCPYNPKPMCKKCETQCYSQNYRKKVREVMRFSGPHLIKRGRLDLLYHYLV